MNNEEDSKELLDWDNKNIVRFAQFLYDLAKEQVHAEKVVITDESTLENSIEPEMQLKDTAPEEEIKEEVLEEPEEEIKEEILEEPEVDKEIQPTDEQIQLDKELQEVTIGLAKAVSGEDIGEIDASDKTEIQEIIEKEQIPLPSEGKRSTVETHFDEALETPETSTDFEEITIKELPEKDIKSLESVDLSSPIVKEPVINEQILIQPENIPIDIHNLIFKEETTSVPITKEEIIISTTEEPEQDIVEVTSEIAGEPIVEKVDLDQIIHESAIDEIISEPEAVPEQEITPEQEIVAEEIIPQPEVVTEEKVEELDADATQRRQSIIEQMLSETKKRVEQEGFKVRELGETEGRSYSAVVFGNESSKNVKKWKKWEKRRLRQEKKKKK